MKLILCLFLMCLLGHVDLTMADSNVQVSKLSEIPVEEIELDYSLLSNIERSQKIENSYFKKDLDLILKAKFKIINGDLKMAEFYLNQINNQTTNLLPVKKRYMALIRFIEGKFKDSLQLIDDPKMNNIGSYSHICLLRLVNMMALDLTVNLKDEAVKCMSETEKYSRNDQYWLDTMIKLKTKDFKAVKRNMLTDVERTLNNDEMSRLWLKTGLFLNKEKDLLDILSLLPESSYQSKKIREIVALMYLRNGAKDKALMFIDDVDSANAENIKGNINLQDKQYELAFGHFKLALAKKADSENALERSLPLSWLLNQFEDGLSMLNKVSNKNLDQRKKRAIKIAFLIRLKKYAEAQDELLILKNQFQNIPPFEVNLMDSYLQMVMIDKKIKIDKRKIEESSELSCRSFDGISCWVSLSQIHWENIGKTVKRNESILAEKENSIESFKTKKEIVPLKEGISVDQKDIEELDSDTVQLNPN